MYIHRSGTTYLLLLLAHLLFVLLFLLLKLLHLLLTRLISLRSCTTYTVSDYVCMYVCVCILLTHVMILQLHHHTKSDHGYSNMCSKKGRTVFVCMYVHRTKGMLSLKHLVLMYVCYVCMQKTNTCGT
jgi:hypothetical protein